MNIIFNNFFSEIHFYIKNLKLKIEYTVSTVSHGYYIKNVSSLGLQWWQHMIIKSLDEHCIAAEVADLTKTVLTTRIQLCTSNPTIPF
jgi:hypothetical protein